MEGGGSVGTLIFIVGSLSTCGLALLIATPFALGSAIFMTEIAPKFGEKFYRPVIQIFAGIPSVVYGWVGLTVLVPFIRDIFHRQVGHSILAAGLVLAIISHILARLLKTPVTTTLIPAILTIVPGAGMYQTVYYLFTSDTQQALSSLVGTIGAAGAIAIAIFIVDALVAVVKRIVL